MKRSTTFVLLSTVIVLLLMIVGGSRIVMARTVSVDAIMIREISVAEGRISIHGLFTSSGADYHGYTIWYEGDTAFIELKGSMFATGKRDGAFDISAKTEGIGADIHAIYLRDGEKERLIWPQGGS